MKNVGVFYGSSTGTCEDLAQRIAEKLGVTQQDVHDISRTTAADIEKYDVLVLGTSTWGAGEFQDDWYEGVKTLKSVDLSSKSVALFGCGDSSSFSDTFCDGMGALYEELKDSGCNFIGNGVATDDYTFDASIAVENGKFVGLALDEVNESYKTDERIEAWTATLN